MNLASWVESANGHPDFPIQNLPFGVFDPGISADLPERGPRGGIRIGDQVLDLAALAAVVCSRDRRNSHRVRLRQRSMGSSRSAQVREKTYAYRYLAF